MPSNYLILCPFLLPPSIFPSIRVNSDESVLCIRWPNIGVSASESVLPMDCARPGVSNAPDPVACHGRPTPLLETPGHSQANLAQSPVGSLLLSPGSWCAQGFVYALQESVFLVLCKFCWFYGRVNGDHFQEGLCHTGQPLSLQQATSPLLPQETLRHSSGSVSVGWACISCPSQI